MHANDGASGLRLVEAYYEAIDAGDYDRLASVLAPDVVHDRPDRTLSGREAFVSFMRTDRPETDTRHEVTATYRAVDAAGRGAAGGRADAEGAEWAARGRLIGSDGGVRFAFVDLFEVGEAVVEAADGRGDTAAGGGLIRRIETFARADR